MSARSRITSFMSSFSSKSDKEKSTPPTSPPPTVLQTYPEKQDACRPTTPQRQPAQPSNIRSSPQRREESGHRRSSSRPISMVQTYQPPLMDVDRDTLPELQPIFSFLNSHGNKLYQEGYFLKLDDQNTQGKPNADRTWTECFAQLVGTIFSLWDAAELDAAGADGEVLPKFINLTDASIKMIESLPLRSSDEQPLQNVLSISTAGKNRYLLHFNSHHSLVQWTAAIRLAMYEYTTLQESYTGALIAGKGKTLNNINVITSRTIFKYEDWVRVRFGAGTPWRQCWCVVYPPDEKEVAKLEKELKKKKSVYDRSRPPTLKGSIKFYENKKVGKKTIPIASINDAYSAYAIYPQSKPLIDASTLVKLEGTITIHSNPPTQTEGFVFVMPEVHAAVSGFEMMLRWLFPVYDTFALYGRPQRLVADSLDPRSLMFAMPTERRYGYLELLDVAGLISEPGSQGWNECEWRKRLKELTQRRMTAIAADGGSRRNSRRGSDRASIQSTPAVSWGAPPVNVPGTADGIPRIDSALAGQNAQGGLETPRYHQHHRSASDSFQNRSPMTRDAPPPLHPHATNLNQYDSARRIPYPPQDEIPDRTTGAPVPELQHLNLAPTPQPVSKPPGFSHAPGQAPPANKLAHSPELRRAKSRMSNGTLSQLAGAGGIAAQQGVAEYQRGIEQQRLQDEQQWKPQQQQGRGVHNTAILPGSHANPGLREGMVDLQRLSHEFAAPDYRAPEERSSFSATNIPSYYHRNNPNSNYPNLAQGYNPVGSRGPGLDAFPNQQVAAVAGYNYSGASRSSYESARSSYDAGTGANLRSIQRKPIPSSPAGNTEARAPLKRVKTNMSGSSSNYDEPPLTTPGLEAVAAAQGRPSYDRPSFERPRTGVMKTVGGNQDAPPRGSNDTPTIDFGPTIIYERNRLDKREISPMRQNPAYSAGPQQLQPRRTPEPQQNQGPRHAEWRPGMVSNATAVATRAMTPEGFVRERANAAKQPSQYAHQRRKLSNNNMRTNTPPQGRSDYFGTARNNTSQDLHQMQQQRPGSRGAGATLGNQEKELNARKRTEISRMTGAPLISLAGNANPQRNNGPQMQQGLLGSIDQRELEKRQMRMGVNEQQRAQAQQAQQRSGQQHGYGQQSSYGAYGQQGNQLYGQQQ